MRCVGALDARRVIPRLLPWRWYLGADSRGLFGGDKTIVTQLHAANTSHQPERTAGATTLTGMLLTAAWMCELSADQKEQIIADASERHVPARAYICRLGESVDYWYGVIEGLAKVSIMSASGRLMTLAGVTHGGWFGEGSLLKDEPRRYDAIALRDTRIACIPRATFRWLCGVSIPFNRFLVSQINERCGQFVAMLQAERLFDRDTRVAHCLWLLSNPRLYPGFGPHLEISQEEIGHLAGLSRQQTNQALHALEKRGLLRVDHLGVTVLDLPGLGQIGT